MDLEAEIRWNIAQARGQGLTPAAEVRRWKRRFWCACSVAIMAIL